MTTISLNLEQAEKKFQLLDHFLDEVTKLANEIALTNPPPEMLEEISEIFTQFLLYLMMADTDRTVIRNLLEGKDNDEDNY